MGNYFFPKDLEESKVAVEISRQYILKYHGNHTEANILLVDRQKEGDIEVIVKDKNNKLVEEYTVEVKYDMMARKTGNLCFEISNGAGDLTGIASTDAHIVHYVVPKDNGFTLYEFDTDELKDYIFDSLNHNNKKVRQVKGGDRKAYSMLLVSIDNIINDDLPMFVEEIDA